MKTTIKTSTTLLLVAIIFFACKKKDETPPPAATTTTTGSSPAHVNTMTATVNGNNWSMFTNSSGFSAYSIGKIFSTYSFAGQTAFSTPNTNVRVNFTYTTGLVNLTQFGSFNGSYTDSAGTVFTSKTGTLNIVTLDTLPSSQGLINKFKANFSFVTDTISNKSYTINGGFADYIKQ
jgi:hypothetical protein